MNGDFQWELGTFAEVRKIYLEGLRIESTVSSSSVTKSLFRDLDSNPRKMEFIPHRSIKKKKKTTKRLNLIMPFVSFLVFHFPFKKKKVSVFRDVPGLVLIILLLKIGLSGSSSSWWCSILGLVHFVQDLQFPALFSQELSILLES